MDTSNEISTFEAVQMVLRARLENKEIDFSSFDEHSNWEVLRSFRSLKEAVDISKREEAVSAIIENYVADGFEFDQIESSSQELINDYEAYLIDKGELVDVKSVQEKFAKKYPYFKSIFQDDAESFITYHNQSGKYFEREMEAYKDYKELVKSKMDYADAYADHEESMYLESAYLKPIEKFMSERSLKHMENSTSNQLNNRHMSTENENQKESSNELRTPNYEYFAMQNAIRNNLKNYRGKTVPEREGLIDKNLEFLKKWTDSRFQEIILQEDPRKVKHAIKENFKDMRISNYELAFAQNYYQKVKLEMEKSGKDKSVIREFRKDAMSAVESTRSAADYKMINSLDYAIEKAEDDKSKEAAIEKKQEVLDDKMYYAIKAGREIEIDRLASNMDAPGPKTEQLLHDDMYWENRAQNRKHIADMLSDRMNNFETDEQLDKAIEKGLEKDIEKDKGISI